MDHDPPRHSDHPREMQQHPSRRTGEQSWDHPGLETEDCDHGGHRQQERPRSESPDNRDIKRKTKAPDMPRLTKPGVEREPHREIEDDTDDGRGDAGERTADRFVITHFFNERSAEPDPQKTRNKSAPG